MADSFGVLTFSLACFLRLAPTLSDCFCFYFGLHRPILPANMTALTPNLHLPPHLRELCSILATGIVRLRCRTAEDLARDGGQVGPDGETSLHFTAHQSGHADAPSRRHA